MLPYLCLWIFCSYIIVGITTCWAGEPVSTSDKITCGFIWITAPIISPLLLGMLIALGIGHLISKVYR